MTASDATVDAGASLSPSDIRQVLDVLANSTWDEAVVTIGNVTIAVARNGAHLPTAAPAAPAPAAVAAAPVAAAPAVAPVAAAPAAAAAVVAPAAVAGTPVTAPSVGVFWRAPEPGAAPFVEVGQRVEAGTELCIVEVMKLMNRVTAPVSGTIAAVHVGNGDAVEFGTSLFTIAPE